jgi:hypothetical protein
VIHLEVFEHFAFGIVETALRRPQTQQIFSIENVAFSICNTYKLSTDGGPVGTDAPSAMAGMCLSDQISENSGALRRPRQGLPGLPHEMKLDRIGHKPEMDAQRTIREVLRGFGSADSHGPAKDRLNCVTANDRARAILALAQHGRSCPSQRLRNVALVLLVGACLGAAPVHAQNATWEPLGLGSQTDWNNPENWDSETVPTGIATFGSPPTTVTSTVPTTVATIQFNAGAPAFSFGLTNAAFDLTGSGIVNNSSNVPTFTISANGTLRFLSTTARARLAMP